MGDTVAYRDPVQVVAMGGEPKAMTGEHHNSGGDPSGGRNQESKQDHARLAWHWEGPSGGRHQMIVQGHGKLA